jgi:hypothetical protein
VAQIETEWVALIAGKYYELAGHVVMGKWDPGLVNTVFMFGFRIICGTVSTGHTKT